MKEAISLKGLRGAIKNRPTHRWMIDNLDKLEVIESAFEKIEAKFEAFEKRLRETPAKKLLPHNCESENCHYYQAVYDLIEKIMKG